MNRQLKSVMGLVLISVISLTCLTCLTCLTSCNLSPNQIKPVAQSAGLFAAIGWIIIDNPDAEVRSVVVNILSIVEQETAKVEQGESYKDTLFPYISLLIDENVKAQYRSVVKKGLVSLLGGIDMFLAANPKWKNNHDITLEAVNAFISGAKAGFGLKDTDPIMIEARKITVARAAIE